MISEIEIPGSSLSMKAFSASTNNVPTSSLGSVMFDVATERPGFHDFDSDGGLTRGYFSMVVAFEVERLVDGVTTKTLMKRIESCEFVVLPGRLLAWGKGAPMKELVHELSRLSGFGVTPIEWSTEQLQDIQSRMAQVKAVALTNGKNKAIRKARLAGVIEESDYIDIVDPGNHGIESVQGIMETPLGPVTLTVGRKGSLRWGVRKGFILTVECIEWLLGLLSNAVLAVKRAEEEAALMAEARSIAAAAAPSDSEVPEITKKRILAVGGMLASRVSLGGEGGGS